MKLSLLLIAANKDKIEVVKCMSKIFDDSVLFQPLRSAKVNKNVQTIPKQRFKVRLHHEDPSFDNFNRGSCLFEYNCWNFYARVE